MCDSPFVKDNSSASQITTTYEWNSTISQSLGSFNVTIPEIDVKSPAGPSTRVYCNPCKKYALGLCVEYSICHKDIPPAHDFGKFGIQNCGIANPITVAYSADITPDISISVTTDPNYWNHLYLLRSNLLSNGLNGDNFQVYKNSFSYFFNSKLQRVSQWYYSLFEYIISGYTFLVKAYRTEALRAEVYMDGTTIKIKLPTNETYQRNSRIAVDGKFYYDLTLKKGYTFQINGVYNIFQCQKDITLTGVNSSSTYTVGNLDDSDFTSMNPSLLNTDGTPITSANDTVYGVYANPIPASTIAMNKANIDSLLLKSTISSPVGIVNVPIIDTTNPYIANITDAKLDIKEGSQSFNIKLPLVAPPGLSVDLHNYSLSADLSTAVRDILNSTTGSGKLSLASNFNTYLEFCADPDMTLKLQALFSNTVSVTWTETSRTQTEEKEGVLSVSGSIIIPYEMKYILEFDTQLDCEFNLFGKNLGTTDSKRKYEINKTLMDGTVQQNININRTIQYVSSQTTTYENPVSITPSNQPNKAPTVLYKNGTSTPSNTSRGVPGV